MNSLENLRLNGKVHIVITGEDGSIKDERQLDNLVVTTGLTFIANRMAAGSPPAAISHMELGTGTVAPVAGNTTLGTALGTRGTVTATPSTTSVLYSASFAAGAPAAGTNAITEAGLFNAASAGTMLCRVTFAAVNKAPNDTMTVNWTINLVAV